MENIQLSTGLFVYICSRNPIAIWAIENLLTPDSSDFHFSAWSPKQPIVVPEGSHILLIDVCSISEWPEAVRKWTDAGHRTILLVADIWDSEGAELRALHLGVRGIVHVSRVTVRELSEAIGFIARGQLVADAETLDEFYGGTRRLKSPQTAPCLSFREEQVMDLLMQGFSNRRIGTVLGISQRTAKFHVSNILHKLKTKNRRELMDKHGNFLDHHKSA